MQLKSLQLNYDFVRQLELSLKDLDFAKYAFYNKTARDMAESFGIVNGVFKIEGKIFNEPENGKLNKYLKS
jgi:hypothetical protein